MSEFISNKCLCTLLYAIERVSIEYVQYPDYKGIEENDFPHIERVFAYELYRQWTNLLKDLGCPLILNAEISKYKKVCFSGLPEKEGDNTKGAIFPDMVLHHGQGDTTFHKIVCEIKRDLNNNIDEIENDFDKLISLTKKGALEGFPYRWGIMLVYGSNDANTTLTKYRNLIKGRGLINKVYANRVLLILAKYDGNCKEKKPHIIVKKLMDLVKE